MKYINIIILVLLISGCDFPVEIMDNKFGKQNFVSAISIIELHKTRNGFYPENLDELEFLGGWDQIWLSAVKYEKVDNGYNLYTERGWIGKPKLEFDIKFKQGLGIQKSNIKWIAE